MLWCGLSLIPLLACGRPHPGQEQPGLEDSADSPGRSRASEELTGKLFVTGNEPWTSVTLVPPEGKGITLVGGLEGELARLAGASVGVRGVRHDGPPVSALHVETYEVLEIDGEVPTVGVVTVKDGTIRLVGHDTIEVADPPERLRKSEGAKVWIVGQRAGDRLAVQSYGILREARQ
jgi:hypothetical protein